LDRREFVTQSTAAGLGLAGSAFPSGWASGAGGARSRVLFFTRSQGYEHSVVKRTSGKLGLAEQLLTDLGAQHGFEVTCTKDGTVFEPGAIGDYDVFCFYTTGDLTKPAADGSPPMSPQGKAALLNAIEGGKGFVGFHAATDTFLTAEHDRYTSHAAALDPYIAMIGAEFIHHDSQQKATQRIVDPKFPGFEKLGAEVILMDEWYSLKDFAPNLHVLLVQETEGMQGPHYKRAPYPSTWARMYRKGRVFYTSMGHREDVWTNLHFQSMILGGLSWSARNINADVKPNLLVAAPGHKEIPKEPKA
jgi:type 1 glutamine amidotransferase